MLALLLAKHVHHARAVKWQAGQSLAICPITELGFIRVSTQATIGLTMSQARQALKVWKEVRKPRFVACDLSALEGEVAPGSTRTTDFYLANLAEKNGMQLATLDQEIRHKSALLIPIGV